MINQCAPVNCIARWEREADGYEYRYERARAWLDLMGSNAPLPPPDGFQRAPDGVGWEVPANASAVRTITNDWGDEFSFGPLPLPEQPEAQNIYCVRNHTGMSDCCPDCGTDPEQRRATAFHNGEETEGCYIACPKGCQMTGPFPRAEQAWGQWHAKCRQGHGV